MKQLKVYMVELIGFVCTQTLLDEHNDRLNAKILCKCSSSSFSIRLKPRIARSGAK